MTRPFSAGDITDSRCTRCKTVMNHTIVAMVGDKIVRVQCNTCGSTHNHHPPVKPSVAPRTVQRSKETSRTSKPSQDEADRQEWASLAQDLDPTAVRPYAMDSHCRPNEALRHPVFGIGIVRRVAEGKAEILFKEGKKLLKCR